MWYRNKLDFLSIPLMKPLSLCFLFLLSGLIVHAQNNTSSPYSYYGLGELNPGVNGSIVGMGGTNLAFQNGNNLNVFNPASLAGIDSLKFIFNTGLTSKYTKMNQKGKSDNFHDNNFTHLAFGFRVSPMISTSLSLIPYTNVGYEISTRELVVGTSTDYFQRTLSGSGGLNKFVWSNGVKLTENLYLGANAIFLFGNNTTDEILTMDNSSYVYLSQQQLISRGIYANIGVQFHHKLTNEWDLSMGGKFQPKQSISSKRKFYVTNYQSSVGDTIYKNTLDRGTFDVPMTYGLGLGFVKKKQLFVGADYLHEKWSNTKIFKKANQLVDRNRFSVGMNYIANDGYETKFLKKMTYRLGAFYDTGYIKVEDERIKTKGVSFGLGIPMARQKGMINLSFEFGQMGTTDNDNVREDYGKVTVELSLFERWFVKRKYN